MWTVLLSRLKEYWVFVTAIAALSTFLLYDRRKKKLEIKKLELEIQKLSQESLIYRPSFREMKEILEETGHISTRKLGIIAFDDALDDFGIELHRFLSHLLAYYGEPEALRTITTERFSAMMPHQPDPYGDGDLTELPFPNPDRVLRLWHGLRDVAARKLPSKTLSQIDSLLTRFKNANEDA